MPRKAKKKYAPSQVITAAAGYTAGKAVAKATNKVTTAARAAGKAAGKSLKKAAGIKRRGPEASVMPKVSAYRKEAAKRAKANRPEEKIKKAVKGMYPFNVVRKLTGK